MKQLFLPQFEVFVRQGDITALKEAGFFSFNNMLKLEDATSEDAGNVLAGGWIKFATVNSGTGCGTVYEIDHKTGCETGSGCKVGRVFVCNTCSSTLDEAWQLEQGGVLKEWDSVICVAQTSGRGQLRRQWHSPAGNLYAAIKLPSSLHGKGAAVLTGYLVIMGLLKFVSEHRGEKIDLKDYFKLKWPNDILLNNRKTGGILLEEKINTLIAGIGINITSCPDIAVLRKDAAIEATFLLNPLELPINSNNISPLYLWLVLVGGACFCYEQEVDHTSARNNIYLVEKYLAWRGEKVSIGEAVTIEGNAYDQLHGVLAGLGPNGELSMLCSNKNELVESGSLMLK